MAELKKRHEFWLALLIVVLFVGLAWCSDEFLTFGNLYDLANNYAMLTILACGLFVVLISGGIDISFPAMTIIAQYGMVLLLQKMGGNFAVAFALAGGIGRFGLITPLSNHFCATCNRLRVTSDGRLRTCLFDDREYRLAPILRHPRLDDETLLRVLRRATLRKPIGAHLLEKRRGAVARKTMTAIGG